MASLHFAEQENVDLSAMNIDYASLFLLYPSVLLVQRPQAYFDPTDVGELILPMEDC